MILETFGVTGDVTGVRRSNLSRRGTMLRSRIKSQRVCVSSNAWTAFCLIGAATSLLFATSANAQSRDSAAASHDGELERWVASGGIEVGVHGHAADAEFRGSFLNGPRATNIDFIRDEVFTVVRPKADSADVFAGLMGGNFELMSPAYFDVPSRPRFFLDVSLLGVLSSETAISRLGDPGEYSIPTGLAISVPFVGERLVFGTGTQVTAQNQDFQFHLGLGPAFTIDFGPDRIRIKPSVVYSRTETRVSVEARRAVRLINADPIGIDPMTGNTARIRSLDAFRFITLADDFTEVYHGLGPALEVEYETDNRYGPFLISLFIKGGASHLFGDLKTEFVVANPDFPLETVRFKYKNNRWTYRASTGIRFRFVPISSR